MIRIDLDVGTFRHLRPSCRDEPVEQIVAVLRAGRGLGMVLHGEDRLAVDLQPFQVPSNSGHGSRYAVAAGCRITDKAVVLAGDLDLAGGQVLDRVVGAAMADVPS